MEKELRGYFGSAELEITDKEDSNFCDWLS